ncbi:hypothetical protein ACFLZS_00370 [Patescibacteria group bacterium]
MKFTKLKILIIFLVTVITLGGIQSFAFAANDFKTKAKEVITGVVESNSKAEGEDYSKYQKENAELRYFRMRITAIEKTSSGLKQGNVVQVLYYIDKNSPADYVPVLAESGKVLKIWANPTETQWRLNLASDGKAINLVKETVTEGPSLTIDSPQDSSEFDYNRITIKGSTEPGAILLINGLIVEVPASGQFEAPVYLSAYKNVFGLVAIGSQGGETRKTVTLIYKGAKISSQLQLKHEIRLSEEEVVKGEIVSYFIDLENQGSEDIINLRLTTEIPEGVSLVESNPRFNSAAENIVVINLNDPLKKGTKRSVEIKARIGNDLDNGSNLPLKVTVTGSNTTRTDDLAETFEDEGPLLVRSKGGIGIWTYLIPLSIIFYILISLGSGYLIAKHLVKRSISKN